MSKNVPKVKETKDPYKATLCTYTYCQHSLPFKTFSCLKKHLIRKSYQIRFLLLIFDGFSRSCFECQVFECCPFFLSFHQSKPSRVRLGGMVAFVGFIDLVQFILQFEIFNPNIRDADKEDLGQPSTDQMNCGELLDITELKTNHFHFMMLDAFRRTEIYIFYAQIISLFIFIFMCRLFIILKWVNSSIENKQ